VRGLAVLLLAVPAVVGAQTPEAPRMSSPAFERVIEVPGPGLFAVRLDRHVYEAARADLGDLRILDRHEDDVPYVLDRGLGRPRPETRPRMRNRGHAPDRSATVILDFGGRLEKDRLVLRLTGQNFRRRVKVEGGDDGESWTTLVDDAWVFAIPGPQTARYEEVVLPGNDFPLLRVTVAPGARERMRVEILEAWVPAGGSGPRREETLSPAWSRAAEARPGETWLTLDLGARRQPFEAVVLDVEDERFFREVRTEIRRDVGEVPRNGLVPSPRWDPLGEGAVYRLGDGGRERAKLRIDARGRARALRVRVLNGDDRPLVLGAPVRRDAVADVLPWTERHPALLWVGLLAVVAALGALTWRALRSA
jgi:hypothetical protein